MEIFLSDLQSGKKAKLKRLEGGPEFQAKLASLNIRIGKIIKVITVQPLGGPVVVEIDSRRVSIGRRMAMRIVLELEQ